MTVFRDCYLQISTDAVNWTDLSDSGTVEIPTGAGRRQTSTLHPYGADVPIIIAGRRDPMKLIITYDYQDAARDVTILGAYLAKTAFYVRFAPRGNVDGNFLYTSAAGLVTSPPYPEGQKHSGSVVLTRLTFETPALTRSTIGIA